MKELDGKAELVYLWVRAYIEEGHLRKQKSHPIKFQLANLSSQG